MLGYYTISKLWSAIVYRMLRHIFLVPLFFPIFLCLHQHPIPVPYHWIIFSLCCVMLFFCLSFILEITIASGIRLLLDYTIYRDMYTWIFFIRRWRKIKRAQNMYFFSVKENWWSSKFLYTIPFYFERIYFGNVKKCTASSTCMQCNICIRPLLCGMWVLTFQVWNTRFSWMYCYWLSKSRIFVSKGLVALFPILKHKYCHL